jgi:putative transposase
VKPAAQRKAVEHARQLFGISERRACTIFGVDRTSVRYAPRHGDDGDLRSRLRATAARTSSIIAFTAANMRAVKSSGVAI